MIGGWPTRRTCAGSRCRCRRPSRARTVRLQRAEQGQAQGLRLVLDGAGRPEAAQGGEPGRPRGPGRRRRRRRSSCSTADPEKFFTEPHYNGYPAVLVRLAAVDVDELRELLTDACGPARRRRRCVRLTASAPRGSACTGRRSPATPACARRTHPVSTCAPEPAQHRAELLDDRLGDRPRRCRRPARPTALGRVRVQRELADHEHRRGPGPTRTARRP